MKLAQQLKTALNDNRLLILGTQVLFGFQFNVVFQEMFETLALTSRALACAGIKIRLEILIFRASFRKIPPKPSARYQ